MITRKKTTKGNSRVPSCCRPVPANKASDNIRGTKLSSCSSSADLSQVQSKCSGSSAAKNISPSDLTFTGLGEKLAAASFPIIGPSPTVMHDSANTMNLLLPSDQPRVKTPKILKPPVLANSSSWFPAAFLNFSLIEGKILHSLAPQKTFHELEACLANVWNNLSIEEQKKYESKSTVVTADPPGSFKIPQPPRQRKVTVVIPGLQNSTYQKTGRVVSKTLPTTVIVVPQKSTGNTLTNAMQNDKAVLNEPERAFSLSSANDEDTMDVYTEKHVAHARYQRNHMLMSNIFSDTKVGLNVDINEAQLKVLRCQTHLLEDQKMLIEKEIEDMNKSFEEKKRKYQEDTDNFNKNCKKLSLPFTDVHIGVLAERLYQRWKLRLQMKGNALFENQQAGMKSSSHCQVVALACPENMQKKSASTHSTIKAAQNLQGSPDVWKLAGGQVVPENQAEASKSNYQFCNGLEYRNHQEIGVCSINGYIAYNGVLGGNQCEADIQQWQPNFNHISDQPNSEVIVGNGGVIAIEKESTPTSSDETFMDSFHIPSNFIETELQLGKSDELWIPDEDKSSDSDIVAIEEVLLEMLDFLDGI